MKVDDYIICKSIPNDAPDGALTIDKMYRIVGVTADLIGVTDDILNERKVYFILSNDDYPYLIMDSRFHENFESLRSRNLDLLI